MQTTYRKELEMSPQFVAAGIAMFYSLGIIEQVAMADDLNASLLSLGSSWWSDNLEAVADELISRYQQRNAANSVREFVRCYSCLF